MFQFPGFAFIPYGFRNEYLLLISASPKIAKPHRRPQTFRFEAAQAKPGRRPASAHPECASRGTSTDRLFGITEIEGGFPHSEILGSKPVRGSPRLIAAYHVLHGLSAPRHPPDTLMTLDCSHNQRAGSEHRSRDRLSNAPLGKTERALGSAPSVEKTSFASNTSGSLAVKRGPRLRCSGR